MRNRFADVFFELGSQDPRMVMVVADISPAGSIAKFRTEYPDRFVNTGVAEQIMIGMCAGMSQRGLRPFAYTIATFAIFRPFEFLRIDLCYQNLPVTVVGIGGGVTYSTLGATHHAMEDVAIACSVPNLQVIAPCDPRETADATRWCAIQENGPVYLRLGKAGEQDMTEESTSEWEFGKIRYLDKYREGGICILSYGPIIKLAREIGSKLESEGKQVNIVSVHTLKPLDTIGILKALKSHDEVVVIEEMIPYGGLYDRVRALAFEAGATCGVSGFSLRDEFIHTYGSHEELLLAHGLGADKIADKLLRGGK